MAVCVAVERIRAAGVAQARWPSPADLLLCEWTTACAGGSTCSTVMGVCGVAGKRAGGRQAHSCEQLLSDRASGLHGMVVATALRWVPVVLCLVHQPARAGKADEFLERGSESLTTGTFPLPRTVLSCVEFRVSCDSSCCPHTLSSSTLDNGVHCRCLDGRFWLACLGHTCSQLLPASHDVTGWVGAAEKG